MNAAILYHFAGKSAVVCDCAYCRRFGRNIKGSVKRANNRAARRVNLDLTGDGIQIVLGVVHNDVDTFTVEPDLDLFDRHVELYHAAWDAAERDKYDYFDYDSEPLPESYQPVRYECGCDECGCGKYR